MRGGKPVDHATDADGVVLAAPIAALDGDAARDAAVDVGEGQNLVLAVVPACPRKYADILDELLLQIGIEAVFRIDVANARHHVVDILGGVSCLDRQRLAIIAGYALVAERAEPELAGLVEEGMALFEFDHRTTSLERQDVAVRLRRHLDECAAHRPVLAIELD